MSKKRFETIYTHGVTNDQVILVDKETGINYLFVKAGYAGGITPLLDKNGKPVVTPVDSIQQ